MVATTWQRVSCGTEVDGLKLVDVYRLKKILVQKQNANCKQGDDAFYCL
jgi:hypothetical protein